MKETVVKCPKCGAEFDVVANKQHTAQCTVVGKDSGLGTVYLPVKNEDFEQKKALLEGMGLNVDKFIELATSMGMTMQQPVEQSTGKQAEQVRTEIQEKGYIRNPQLARRWIAAQMLRMMFTGGHGHLNFVWNLRDKGYEYQFKVITDELIAQRTISRDNKKSMKKGGKVIAINDHDYLLERKHFYSHGMIIKVAEEYVQNLKKHLNGLKVHHCKGVKYIKTNAKYNPKQHGNVFVDDIQSRIIWPMERLVSRIKHTSNVANLCDAWVDFMKFRIPLRDCEQSKIFVDAYKGAGAYYTMKNLIAYHGLRIQGTNGSMMDMQHSLNELRDCGFTKKGWELFGMLRQFLNYNNFDYEAKVAEWRKAA